MQSFALPLFIIDAKEAEYFKVITVYKTSKINRYWMKINFLEIAQNKLDNAIEYYNYESPGLGDVFLTEDLNALDRIGEFPEAWHPCSKQTRR